MQNSIEEEGDDDNYNNFDGVVPASKIRFFFDQIFDHVRRSPIFFDIFDDEDDFLGPIQ